MKVYVLQHEHELDDESTDVKLIGVYGSEADALAARQRLSAAPGFQDDPNGFSIDAYELGRDHWTDGFNTIPSDDSDTRAKSAA